ncbi:hypothetical protein LR48_Vigan10g203100 [Vigna angularis]|uniref:Uncharacterized protein n=1 Tax=Phaseolus angularis TaxID=3914 RepID=A0A0L9VN18_PHAAN|nr:hypothetical protein LR48_Vigan10g203100 [Vigna angularis]
MIGAFVRVTGVEVVAASSLAQKIGSFSVLNRGVIGDSPAGSMVVLLVAASAGSRRRIATVVILVHVVGVARIDETPLAREKRGRRFRLAASSVGGIVGDALGR